MALIQKLEATGKVVVERYSRETGEFLGRMEAPNALVVAGRNHILDRMAGLVATAPLDATSVLVIRNSGNTIVKTLTGTEPGFPQHAQGAGNATVTLRWRDGSNDTYSANTLEVYFSGGTIQLNTLSPAFGTKPINEAWVYTFTLTLSVGSSALTAAGCDAILRVVSGNSANTFNAARTQIRVFSTWDGTTGTVLLDWVAATSGPSRTNQTVTWNWVVPAGTATGAWAAVQVRNGGSSATIRSGTTGSAAKSALTQRTYTYGLSL